jgi:nitrogenase subunit NifH
MKTTERRTCDQCQLVRINGVVCHETGCPNAPVRCSGKGCDNVRKRKNTFGGKWRCRDCR